MKVSPILKVCVRIRTHVITAPVVREKHSKLLWKTVDMAKPSTIGTATTTTSFLFLVVVLLLLFFGRTMLYVCLEYHI